MSTEDKLHNKAEELGGKAKEVYGEKSGDEDLANEGRGDQIASHAKQAGEHVKDAANDAKDALSK